MSAAMRYSGMALVALCGFGALFGLVAAVYFAVNGAWSSAASCGLSFAAFAISGTSVAITLEADR